MKKTMMLLSVFAILALPGCTSSWFKCPFRRKKDECTVIKDNTSEVKKPSNNEYKF